MQVRLHSFYGLGTDEKDINKQIQENDVIQIDDEPDTAGSINVLSKTDSPPVPESSQHTTRTVPKEKVPVAAEWGNSCSWGDDKTTKVDDGGESAKKSK